MMIYLNNRLVPKHKARISVFDHGFLYGDGIYETLRIYRGHIFKLDEHIDRLYRSAGMIGLTVPKKPEDIRKAVYKTITSNKHSDAVVRITISRGAGPLGLDPALCRKPTFVIMSNRFKKYPDEYFSKGVHVAIVGTRRNYGPALDPRIKSLNFLNNVLAKIEAKQNKAFEALMMNYQGYLAEGTVSNVFFLNKKDVLCTPSVKVGILEGITRGMILEIASEIGLKHLEGRFRKKHIYDAKEVFLTNTSMEVMPVSRVDHKRISLKSGSITSLIRDEYKKKVSQFIETYAN